MIRFEGVCKRYSGPREAWVLENIDLRIEVGEMVFLLGASGAGKSTLLKLVTLEERPSKGRVRVQQYDSTTIRRRQVPDLRRRCGVVYQDFRLIRDKTVQENVAYVLRMTGVLDPDLLKNECRRVLTTVGLFQKRNEFPENLSGGEQQRTAIARALVHQPSILLADEPTGNLDPGMGTEIMEILRRVNLAGATVMIATHDRDLAERFAQRVLVLDSGRLRSDTRIRPKPGIAHGAESAARAD
jgi:cell division transport system ATP-binding protein